MRRYRALPAVVFAILVSALVGGFFGRNALATDDKIPEHYKAFSVALRAIEDNYIDKVDSDNLVYGAVRGMLGTLDPHSSFFSPKEYAQMRERQEGHYYGLGITIQNTPDGDVMAMGVFEGSPAYKKGVRRGDIIAWIAGEDAKGWTTEQAMRKLRGPKGTTVDIGLKRRGYDELIRLVVTRDEVTIPTVPGLFHDRRHDRLHPDAGFRREHRSRRQARAARAVVEGHEAAVVRHPRQSGRSARPGDQGGQRVPAEGTDDRLHARPRAEFGSDYRATDDGEFTEMPIVLLANRNSASASEIVTGALQDHDRAYIVGETTFGKALVQSVYRISGNAGLALTTAHYYTPSGRLIQRPWDASFDEYLSYSLRDQDAEQAAQPDRSEAHRCGPARSTAAAASSPTSGSPDRSKASIPGRFGRMLYARSGVSELRAEVHGGRRHARLDAAATGRKTVKPNFVVDDAMMADFREQLKTDKIKIDEEGFAKDLDFIKAMIRFDIDNAVFGVADARRHLIGVDPQAQVGADDVRRGAEADRDEQGRRRPRRIRQRCTDGVAHRACFGQATTMNRVVVCACPYR